MARIRGRLDHRHRRHPHALLIAVDNIIRALRSEQGLTQAQLAELLEVSRQTVNSLEKGRYDPSLPLAFRIARVLGKQIEEIFSE